MKSIIWKIELAAAVLLAISALVWGLRPGVWNYGGFYRMAAGEQGRTYTRPGCSTVEVTEDNRLRHSVPRGADGGVYPVPGGKRLLSGGGNGHGRCGPQRHLQHRHRNVHDSG